MLLAIHLFLQYILWHFTLQKSFDTRYHNSFINCTPLLQIGRHLMICQFNPVRHAFGSPVKLIDMRQRNVQNAGSSPELMWYSKVAVFSRILAVTICCHLSVFCLLKLLHRINQGELQWKTVTAGKSPQLEEVVASPRRQWLMHKEKEQQ